MTQQRCYYHPLRRVRTRYSVGAKIFLLLWAAGVGGTLYSLHSLKLYQPVLSAILPASEQKRSYAINCGTGHRVS